MLLNVGVFALVTPPLIAASNAIDEKPSEIGAGVALGFAPVADVVAVLFPLGSPTERVPSGRAATRVVIGVLALEVPSGRAGTRVVEGGAFAKAMGQLP